MDNMVKDGNSDETFEVRDLRGGDWFWAPNVLLSDDRLKLTDKLAYLALASYANRFQVSWPSVKTIAEICNISERGCQYALRRLADTGWIKVIIVPNKTSKYILLRVEPRRGAKSAPGANNDNKLTGVGVHVFAPEQHEQYKTKETESSTMETKTSEKPATSKIIEATRKDLIAKGILPKR